MNETKRRAPRARSPRKHKGFGEERRAEILAAAIDSFATEGYASVTTRALAAKAGLSQTGLYLYFKTKEDVLRAIGEATHEALIVAFDEAAAGARAPGEKMRKLLRAYVDFGLARPAEYQLTFTVGPDALAPIAKDFSRPGERQTAGERSFLCFRNHLAALKPAGVIGDLDPMVAAQILWLAGHGAVSLLVSRKLFPWVDRELLIEVLLDVLTKGLLGAEKR